MLFNAHVHMSQWGRDFTPELADVHLAQFAGRDSWITGEPWTPEGWCIPGDDLIRHMDEAGVDRALIMCLAYVPVGAYDPTMGEGGTLFIAAGGQIYAVDPATGRDRWAPVSVGTMHGNMAITNGLIFANTGAGGLKIVEEATGAHLRTIVPPNAGAHSK